MRLNYHLKKRQDNPKVSISILDNCVGQNKSNIVFKFFCFLSLCFYEKVVLLYLIPGHSHMIADRVVAWSKGQIRGLDLFHPKDLVDTVNRNRSIEAVLVDKDDPNRPCFVGWDTLMNKYFDNMPSGFTFNYYF